MPCVLVCSADLLCENVKVSRGDTTTLAWNSAQLAQDVCSILHSADQAGHFAVMFTHGSGTLVAGSALQSRCPQFVDKVMWYDLQADYPLGRLVEFGTAFCPSMHAGQAGDWAVALQRDFHLCSGPDLASGWRDLVRVGCWVFGGRGVGIGCL